ncbi:MAG: hypothetical protein JO307_12885 [Bryobacterales bacterium]|nr:hypothetical protein [Bryobacterales bacterium]MBV9396478.1 hypothetical protein [Bryobacterales bacterium]
MSTWKYSEDIGGACFAYKITESLYVPLSLTHNMFRPSPLRRHRVVITIPSSFHTARSACARLLQFEVLLPEAVTLLAYEHID